MFVYFACCCFLFACLLFHQDDRIGDNLILYKDIRTHNVYGRSTNFSFRAYNKRSK